MTHPPGTTVLMGLRRIVTFDSDRPGEPAEVNDGSIAMYGGRIAWVGPSSELPVEYEELPRERFDGLTAVPGFVDSHTHAVFAGDRRDEFRMRLEGASYEDIMSAGGGIHATVEATRSASADDLYHASRARLEAMLANGTTTVEIKSGYGLDLETELRQLMVVERLREGLRMDLRPTFLAHAIPPGTDRAEHLDLLVSSIIPACAEIAESCDVFCDVGVFDTAEAAAILEAGSRHGLTPRIHAEQLAHSGGAQVAAMVGAASADHLDHVDEADIMALRDAGVVATLLPGVSFTMRHPQPPGRALWDAGVTVAIATDCNPGTSYVTSMPFVMTLAVLELGLTVEEALWSATRGGARSLRIDAGHIRVGAPAAIVVLDSDSPVDLVYRPDARLVTAVFASGLRIH